MESHLRPHHNMPKTYSFIKQAITRFLLGEMIVLSRVDNTEKRWWYHPISPCAIQSRIRRVCDVWFAFLSDSCLVCGKVVHYLEKWTYEGEWSGWNYSQAMRNACFHVGKYACAAQKAIKIWFWVTATFVQMCKRQNYSTLSIVNCVPCDIYPIPSFSGAPSHSLILTLAFCSECHRLMCEK